MKKYLSKTSEVMQSGFTLVELLIVIALLGVIATIVIAAINPIEQANRASDAGMEADASQIISAISRYYVAHSIFPWNASSCVNPGTSSFCDSASGSSADDAFTNGAGAIKLISADDAAVGVCGASGTGCRTTATLGELANSLEIQKTFVNKNWVGVTTVSSQLWVGKASGASSAAYVCWIPKATTNRQNIIKGLRVYDLTKALTSAGSPAAGDLSQDSTGCLTAGGAGWKTGACAQCLP